MEFGFKKVEFRRKSGGIDVIYHVKESTRMYGHLGQKKNRFRNEFKTESITQILSNLHQFWIITEGWHKHVVDSGTEISFSGWIGADFQGKKNT